jgi:hypothetical protein
MAMRRFWAVFALLAGCAPPETTPPSPEDRVRLQETLRSALESPYVLARFYAEYEVDNQVKVSCRGTTRGFRSGVVLVEEESPTGAPLRVLRVGDRAWVFKDGWQDAIGTGLEGLGTGFQNPYEVLSILDSAAAPFVISSRGWMMCPDMKDMGFLLPLLSRSAAAPPAGSRIEGALKSGFKGGPLPTRFSVSNGGSAIWIAKLDIVTWGAAPPMQFDEVPAPFTPEMRAAVRKATEGR